MVFSRALLEIWNGMVLVNEMVKRPLVEKTGLKFLRQNWGWAGNLCIESIGECRRGTGRRAVSRGTCWWRFAQMRFCIPPWLLEKRSGPWFSGASAYMVVTRSEVGGSAALKPFMVYFLRGNLWFRFGTNPLAANSAYHSAWMRAESLLQWWIQR